MNMETFLNAVPLPQMVIGRDARIRAANAGMRQILGGAVPGQHYVVSLRHPGLLECIEQVLTGERATAETAWTDSGASGGETRYRVVAAQIGGDGVLVSFTDTTDLQAAGAMRRDFVANVSHELRTPLTALIGIIETLQGPARDDPAARDRFLPIMAREAARMNRLVADLLSLSRVEAEERVRPREEVDLTRLVRATVAALRPSADADGVALIADEVADGVCIAGDADQLTQVISNLLDNAIKYGGRGAEVRVALQASENWTELRGPGARLTVSDTGEGIDPIHIPRLTERFYRADSHRSREMGGTGLGLAIVKHIVNRHRGRLVIASAPGQGSQFSVFFPPA